MSSNALSTRQQIAPTTPSLGLRIGLFAAIATFTIVGSNLMLMVVADNYAFTAPTALGGLAGVLIILVAGQLVRSLKDLPDVEVYEPVRRSAILELVEQPLLPRPVVASASTRSRERCGRHNPRLDRHHH